MYTNAGILAMMTVQDVALNLEACEGLLKRVESGKLEAKKSDFDALCRWEEDAKAYFVRLAEQMGLTNTQRLGMKKL